MDLSFGSSASKMITFAIDKPANRWTFDGQWSAEINYDLICFFGAARRLGSKLMVVFFLRLFLIQNFTLDSYFFEIRCVSFFMVNKMQKRRTKVRFMNLDKNRD